jgi:hypothetical protein
MAALGKVAINQPCGSGLSCLLDGDDSGSAENSRLSVSGQE